jgi:hypothetical protein
MALNKIIIITTIVVIITVLAWAPWLNNQILHDKVFKERAKIDGTINKNTGELICDYNVIWAPFGRWVASCEGGYYVTFWGKILLPESPITIKENENERCSWEITREDLETLGLHCSQIAGYYYGPAIVGMPSGKYECNPVPGCQYNPAILPFGTKEECEAVCGHGVEDGLIKNYLEENVGIATFGGKVFCAYEVLGEEKKGTTINEYLWVLCREYYLENDNLKEGSGISLPVALIIQEGESGYKVINHKIPRDGNYYGTDIREIFPEEYHAKIFPQPPDYLEYNQRAKHLSEETGKEAELYLK